VQYASSVKVVYFLSISVRQNISKLWESVKSEMAAESGVGEEVNGH